MTMELRYRPYNEAGLDPVSDENPLAVKVMPGDALATKSFEQLTVSTSAVGFTLGKVLNASVAVVTVETASVRYRADGQVPTASVGTILNVGEQIKVTGLNDISAIRFISVTGTSATLDCEYLQ